MKAFEASERQQQHYFQSPEQRGKGEVGEGVGRALPLGSKSDGEGCGKVRAETGLRLSHSDRCGR